MTEKEPLLQEQIDGPTNTAHERYQKLKLAGALSNSVKHMGWFMYHSDAEQEKPQGYRIGSWVEAPDHKLGYAFGISRPDFTPDTLEDFTIRSVHFTVDREHQTLADEPIILEHDTMNTLSEEAEKIVESYNKSEIITALHIVHKLADTIQTGRFHTDMDVHVGYGLILNNLDSLAELFPRPNSPRIED